MQLVPPCSLSNYHQVYVSNCSNQLRPWSSQPNGPFLDAIIIITVVPPPQRDRARLEVGHCVSSERSTLPRRFLTYFWSPARKRRPLRWVAGRERGFGKNEKGKKSVGWGSFPTAEAHTAVLVSVDHICRIRPPWSGPGCEVLVTPDYSETARQTEPSASLGLASPQKKPSDGLTLSYLLQNISSGSEVFAFADLTPSGGLDSCECRSGDSSSVWVIWPPAGVEDVLEVLKKKSGSLFGRRWPAEARRPGPLTQMLKTARWWRWRRISSRFSAIVDLLIRTSWNKIPD